MVLGFPVESGRDVPTRRHGQGCCDPGRIRSLQQHRKG